ncbi:SRPBCC family protein [Streptomyces mirabilis]|uniref:SRPBCC family protein n=1 Tax=Streptomyces mirabilis TaxID=68239 RepID=UPI00340112BB
MPKSPMGEIRCVIDVSAPADVVYRLVVAAENWPNIFPACIHVERAAPGDGADQLRIWSGTDRSVGVSAVRRTLDDTRTRTEFEAETSAMSVSGTLRVEATGVRRCRILLDAAGRAAGRLSAAAADRVLRSGDEACAAALDTLRRHAERDETSGSVRFTLAESIRIGSASASVSAETYAFIRRADTWPRLLRHIVSARLEPTRLDDVETLEVTARMLGGHQLTTKCYRVHPSSAGIFTKDVVLPELMAVHTGSWTFSQEGPELLVTCRHTVELASDRLAAVLGPGASAEDAVQHIRDSLTANDQATLRHVKRLAETG